jgi:hypothetical protein
MSFKPGDRVKSTVHELEEVPYGAIFVPYTSGTVLNVSKGGGDCLVWFDNDDKLIVPARVLVYSDVMGPSAHFREMEKLTKRKHRY